jgi:hypothetical protein
MCQEVDQQIFFPSRYADAAALSGMRVGKFMPIAKESTGLSNQGVCECFFCAACTAVSESS